MTALTIVEVSHPPGGNVLGQSVVLRSQDEFQDPNRGVASSHGQTDLFSDHISRWLCRGRGRRAYRRAMVSVGLGPSHGGERLSHPGVEIPVRTTSTMVPVEAVRHPQAPRTKAPCSRRTGAPRQLRIEDLGSCRSHRRRRPSDLPLDLAAFPIFSRRTWYYGGCREGMFHVTEGDGHGTTRQAPQQVGAVLAARRDDPRGVSCSGRKPLDGRSGGRALDVDTGKASRCRGHRSFRRCAATE